MAMIRMYSYLMQGPYMARESVLRSVVPIDICRVKGEICSRNVRDTNETKRLGGLGMRKQGRVMGIGVFRKTAVKKKLNRCMP